MTIMITLLALAAWAVIWFALNQRLRHPNAPTPPWLSPSRINIYWLIALLLHATSLILVMTEHSGFALDFNTAASLIMFLTSGLLYLAQLKRPLQMLGMFVIPLAILSLIIQLLPHKVDAVISLSNGLGLHITSSLLAYSMLTLATFQALLLALQNYHLHNRTNHPLMRTLPPLMDMEALLFQLILAGVLLLSVGLLSGFFYLNNFFGQHVAHKTILSMMAWLVFTTLLVGHWRYGWRGKIAVRWTLIGSLFLMIGFLGSKFVIEYMVNRA